MKEGKLHMDKAIEHLQGEMSKMRVGRATTAMVDGVKVEAYGSTMTLKEVAAISVPDSRTIAIQPWDVSLINDIEKGILAANLGLTPNNDGKIIRVNLPPLTEERRKEFVKEIKKMGEEAKVAVRNVRRQMIDELKSGGASEDEVKKGQEDIQKQTDHYVKEIDTIIESKSTEVLSL